MTPKSQTQGIDAYTNLDFSFKEEDGGWIEGHHCLLSNSFVRARKSIAD